MEKLSRIWFQIQGVLFPHLEKEIEEPLTEKMRQLIRTLELIRIEEFIYVPEYRHGQSPRHRVQIARAFVAKAVYNMEINRQVEDDACFTKNMRMGKGMEYSARVIFFTGFW